MAEPCPGPARVGAEGPPEGSAASASEPESGESLARPAELSSEIHLAALSGDRAKQVGQQLKEQTQDDDDADDAEDLDFNPLFLRESEEEESEDEEAEELLPAPTPLHALLDESLPFDQFPGPPPFLPSPGARPPVAAVGPFSPGPSAFRHFGLPHAFSPDRAGGPANGSLPLPASLPLSVGAEAASTEEGGEAVDGPARRTRAQVSLAELTMEELETFLQDDEDDFFPGIDDDEEYERFLASISALDDVGAGGGEGAGAAAEDEDEDDVDFVAEEEDAGEEEEEEGQSLIRKRKSGRPRGSRAQKAPMAEMRAAALRRPLAIKPSSLDARFHQMVCHVPSQDGRLRPMLMLKPITAPPPPPLTLPRFTSHQVGQLYCQIFEHVQLLLQLYCVTCLGPPPSRALASRCRAYLEALASARERVLRDKQTAFPERCFQPPCTRPSLHPTVLRDGQLTTLPWAPPVEGPVRSLLDVQPLRTVRDFLQNMTLVIAEVDRKFPPSSGQSFPRASLKPLFPPHPDAHPAQKPSQTIRSILTNQHNPAPLPHPMEGPSLGGEQRNGQGPEGPRGFHSLFLGGTETDPLPAHAPRSLFLEEGLEGAPVGGTTRNGGPPSPQAEPGSTANGGGTLVRGKASLGGGIPEELMKAAKPTLVAMALVAPIVSDLVAEMFQDAFNPALYPSEPTPTARPHAFSEAEDELLALGIQEFNTEWDRIRERFLPTKTVHQIATRVKNRCSSQAPDNIVKQTRQRKTAPLSAQEKFFVDEGILHHGHDWLQLAAYVPRADPALLPKLYREACGLKSKVWKASFARNERRKRQRQRAATERAQQEAAAELRDLTTDGAPRLTREEELGSATDSDPPPEAAASLSVRGLFLEEAPADQAPQPTQPAVAAPPAPGSAVRSLTEAGISDQQPAAKRQKSTPGALPPGPTILCPPGAQRLGVTRPPLRPRATQALPRMGGHPIHAAMPAPGGAKARQEPSLRPSALPYPRPHVRPPVAPHTQPPSTAILNSQMRRTVVVRPQARRATPVTALRQPMPVTSANSFQTRTAGAGAGGGAGAGRPAEASSRAVPSPPLFQNGPTEAEQGQRQRLQTSQPHAAAGSLQPDGGPPSSRAPRRLAPSAPLHAIRVVSAVSATPPASTVQPLPAQTQTASTAQRTTRASLPEISISQRAAQSSPSTHAVPPALPTPSTQPSSPVPPPSLPRPAAPPVPSSPKPWKTRQRQPKAVKAQQKAREAEERRRKLEAKRETDEKQAADNQGPTAPVSVPAPSNAGESTRVGRQPPPQGRPPTVTVHTMRGSGGVTRITHIATGHRSQTHSVGPRPYALRAPGPPPSSIPGAAAMPRGRPAGASGLPPTRPEHSPRAAVAGASVRHPAPAPVHALLPQGRPPGAWVQPPIRPRAVHGVPARGPSMAPPVRMPEVTTIRWTAPGQSSQQHVDPVVAASATVPANAYEAQERHADGRGGGGSSSGQQLPHTETPPVMEMDELTDSDEEDRWQHDEMPDGDDDTRPPTETGGGLWSTAEAAAYGPGMAPAGARGMEGDEGAEAEDDEGEAGRRVGSARGEPELRDSWMEQDELTDSDDEADSEGADAARGMLRGFFLEQDELTESDEEEDSDEQGGGAGSPGSESDGHGTKGLSGTESQQLDDRAASVNAEPSQEALETASVQNPLWGADSRRGQAGERRGRAAERRVVFEKEEMEESEEEDDPGGLGTGVEEDEMTESDEDPG